MDVGAIFRATSAAPRQSTILYSTPIVTSQLLNLRINPNSPLLSSTASFPAGSSGRRIGIGIGLSRKLRFQKRIEAKVGKATKTASIADSEKKWTHYGLITESLPNGMFRVGILNFIDNKFVRVNEDEVLGYVSGKIRTNHIRIVPGDTVRIEVSPYDLNKGRIVYRFSRRDMEKLTGSEDNG